MCEGGVAAIEGEGCSAAVQYGVGWLQGFVDMSDHVFKFVKCANFEVESLLEERVCGIGVVPHLFV